MHLNQLLAGYVELKAVGTGATASRFTGRNRKQFKRFSAIPNILYTDGNEWALYRDGELVDKVVRLTGDVAAEGKKAVGPQDARALESLLRDLPHVAAFHSHRQQRPYRPTPLRRAARAALPHVAR